MSSDETKNVKEITSIILEYLEAFFDEDDEYAEALKEWGLKIEKSNPKDPIIIFQNGDKYKVRLEKCND